MKRRLLALCLLVMAALTVLVVFVSSRTASTGPPATPTPVLQPHVRVIPLHPEPKVGETASCFVAPASLYRLTNVEYYIPGYYSDEWALLGSTPCQDSDYILPYAAQELLTIPGPSTSGVHYLWTGWIAGSGYEMTFGTPNGGRIAYLHVHNPYPFAGNAWLPGGTAVGHSGWPESYQFSNGSCSDYYSCQSDAHLCVATDYAGAAWLYTITYNPPRPRPTPKPTPRPTPRPHRRPFALAVWEYQAHLHHWPSIPSTYHGHLRAIAWAWMYDRRGTLPSLIGSPISVEKYDKRDRLMYQVFKKHGVAYQWLSPGNPVRFTHKGAWVR